MPDVIGGFAGTPPADVYKRWIAFGLLSSHSRLHGNNSYRVPWLFDEEAVDVLRAFTRLKCGLMPYLYGSALEAVSRGIPVMRAMLLEFPEDPTCDFLDRQYMLGPSLLGDISATFTVKREGRVITVKRQGNVKRWQVLLMGIHAVEAVDGGRAENVSQGALVSPGDVDTLTIRLAE
jgi:alpha-D-xyloside xylohydrolase